MIGQNNLVVVAHPDDETLWCGGTIAQHRGVRWYILALSTPSRDPERARHFLDACRSLGATGLCLSTTDQGPKVPLRFTAPLPRDAGGVPFDCVITHNAVGEYGHPHHRQVHELVVHTFANVRLLTFGFRDPGATLGGVLQPPEVKAKLAALKCYKQDLSYEGVVMPKWQAIMKRYGSAAFGIESFREVHP